MIIIKPQLAFNQFFVFQVPVNCYGPCYCFLHLQIEAVLINSMDPEIMESIWLAWGQWYIVFILMRLFEFIPCVGDDLQKSQPLKMSCIQSKVKKYGLGLGLGSDRVGRVPSKVKIKRGKKCFSPFFIPFIHPYIQFYSLHWSFKYVI